MCVCAIASGRIALPCPHFEKMANTFQSDWWLLSTPWRAHIPVTYLCVCSNEAPNIRPTLGSIHVFFDSYLQKWCVLIFIVWSNICAFRFRYTCDCTSLEIRLFFSIHKFFFIYFIPTKICMDSIGRFWNLDEEKNVFRLNLFVSLFCSRGTKHERTHTYDKNKIER